jgi:hypothetical protein
MPGRSDSKIALSSSPTGPDHFKESMTIIISPIEPLAFGFVLSGEFPSGAQPNANVKRRTLEINDTDSFM